MPRTGQYSAAIFDTIFRAFQELEADGVDPDKFMHIILDHPSGRKALIDAYRNVYPVVFSGIPSPAKNIEVLVEFLTKKKYQNLEEVRKFYSKTYQPGTSDLQDRLDRVREENESFGVTVACLSVHENFVRLFDGLDSVDVSVTVMRHGLADGKTASQHQVAAAHGIPYSRCQQVDKRILKTMRANLSRILKPHSDEMLYWSIEDLNLRVHVIRLLQANGITTVWQLVSHNEQELLRFQGVGQASIVHMKEVLEPHGLALKQ